MGYYRPVLNQLIKAWPEFFEIGFINDVIQTYPMKGSIEPTEFIINGTNQSRIDLGHLAFFNYT